MTKALCFVLEKQRQIYCLCSEEMYSLLGALEKMRKQEEK